MTTTAPRPRGAGSPTPPHGAAAHVASRDDTVVCGDDPVEARGCGMRLRVGARRAEDDLEGLIVPRSISRAAREAVALLLIRLERRVDLVLDQEGEATFGVRLILDNEIGFPGAVLGTKTSTTDALWSAKPVQRIERLLDSAIAEKLRPGDNPARWRGR